MTDETMVGVAVLYGGPADGMETAIELDPESGQPTSRHHTLNFSPPYEARRPDVPRPPDVSYNVAVDPATRVAVRDGQGRFRYIIPGLKL